MKVAITGSSGTIGSALVEFLKRENHEVIRLVRTKEVKSSSAVYWNYREKILPIDAIDGIDALINLSGKSIVSGRWTERVKAYIWESRIETTKFLSETIASMKNPPRVFISGSAVGYYGNRGEEICTEQSVSGKGFLANLATEWEKTTEIASNAGIRVANIRTGIILSGDSGVILKMRPIFSLGLGGHLGNGKQYMSWISLEDEVRAIYHIINTPSLSGPINLTSPSPVKNEEFSREFAKSLGRSLFLPVPAFVLKTAFGEMAEEMLLGGQRVLPEKLVQSGFEFKFGEITEALRNLK